MKNIIKLFILSSALLISSCKKNFLDRPSMTQPTLDTYYTNADQVNGATGYLYNQVWASYMDKAFHCIGEVLSGNMLSSAGDANYGNNTYVYFTVQATDGQLLLAWQSLYKVAGNATVLYNTFQQKKAALGGGSNTAYLDQGMAEARFIRGVAYFYIARIFGDAPIVTDPVVLAGSGNYNIPKYQQKDVLRFALEDFKAAEQSLPADPYQPGRVTKYSAIGMAAKLYLYEDKYDSAAIMSKEVISSGKYSLYPDYQKMFTSSTANNNQESLFALQWIASGGYSYANAIQAYAAPSTLLKPDFGTGYSSVIPTIDLLNAYQFGDKRRHWSIMEQGFSNPSWTNSNFPNGFVYDTTWTNSNDDPTKIKTDTRSNSLKYVVGTSSSGEALNSQGGNSMCTYILRYADVLLIYAEATLGTNASTTDASALSAFNLVHQRAGLPAVSSLTKDVILHERRVEFAFEGDYWFDIQRQGFTKAKQILEAQERGKYDPNGDRVGPDGRTISHYGITISSPSQLFLPIPSDEVVADPELAKAAVPYY